MKKILMMLIVAGMLIGVAGCNKSETDNKIYLGMTLQRFLLSADGKYAKRIFYNHKSPVKQDLYGIVEQNFLFHDGILVDWQN